MKKRAKTGGAIAELPAAIMLLLLGIAFPCIIMAMTYYKVYMFQCIVKNSAQVGASQVDLPTATTAAQNYVNANHPAGIVCTTPVCSFVKRTVTYTPTTGGAQNYDTYFLQVTSSSTMEPLVKLPSMFGMSVPGLTTGFPISATQAVYFENQQAAISGGAAAAGS